MSNWSTLIAGPITLPTGSAPTNTPTDYVSLYATGSDGGVYYKNVSGTQTKLG
jgi:hypothetical protein